MKRIALPAVVLMTLASPASAHTGTGIAAGFLHPFSGWDHLIAMLAVGAWAAVLGGRALWALPAAFLAAMALGGAFAMQGFAMPLAETAILASVIVLSALVAFRIKVPAAAGMAIVASFALAHGHAHGAELPAMVNAVTYAAGFVTATSLLHLIGAGVTLLAFRRTRKAAI